MKITYYEPRETELDIEKISLLTLDEAAQLPECIMYYACSWWLRSAGYTPYRAVWVNHDGSIFELGKPVDYGFCAVRPAVTIRNLESLNLEIGDPLMIQGEKYVYIGGSKALYDDEVVYHEFDGESNDYEQSEIKQIVDKWLKGKETKKWQKRQLK